MREPEFVNGQKVLRLEEEADEIRAQVATELDESLVTPIDREDINALSRSVDDIVDYAKTTVEEMMAFQVVPNDHLVRMAEGLASAASAITEAIRALKNDLQKARERVIFAKKRENLLEHLYREALVDLFKGDNVVAMLKMREIYRHLSNAADRCDEAANVLSGIILKST
jgi:predicted phosphate transport protein (TIGR00153 family)